MTWTAIATSPRVPERGWYRLAAFNAQGEIVAECKIFLGPSQAIRSHPAFSGFSHYQPCEEAPHDP